MAALVSADSTASKPQGASPAELSTLVDDLKSGDLDQVKTAILRARRNPADATKLLIDGLRRVSADARQGKLVDPWFCDVTLSLLSELRAKDAVPAILELLSLPGSLPEDLLEDGITETAPRVLAGLAGDQFELLNAMARDERLNEWSRAATIQTRAYLVRDGVLSREAAIKDLQHLLREAIDRSDRSLGGPIVIEFATLGAREAYSLISEAIRSGIVEEGLINLEELEEELGEADYSQHSLARLPPTHVDDTIAEIEGWNWTREADLFDDDPLEMFAPSALTGSTRLTDAEQLFSDGTDGRRPMRHAGHVGRNEPCPCGSGRKFKKCCGKPGT